jgi:hypothetical protein
MPKPQIHFNPLSPPSRFAVIVAEHIKLDVDLK